MRRGSIDARMCGVLFAHAHEAAMQPVGCGFSMGAHLIQEEAEGGVVLLVHGACDDLVRLVVVLVGVALQPRQDVVAAHDVLAPGNTICRHTQPTSVTSAPLRLYCNDVAEPLTCSAMASKLPVLM